MMMHSNTTHDDYEKLQAIYDARSDAYHAAMGKALRTSSFYREIQDNRKSDSTQPRFHGAMTRAESHRSGA